jgi:hypothetical protein
LPEQSARDIPAGSADQVGGRTLYWRLQITGWTLYGAFNAAVALWIAHFPLIQAVGQGAALGVLGLGFSHLLERWIQQRGLATRPLPARVVYSIVLGAAIGVPAGTLIALAGLARPLTALEQRLDPTRFFRANRGQIVNLDFVEAVDVGANDRLHLQLRDEPEVEVSRRQAQLFRRRTVP